MKNKLMLIAIASLAFACGTPENKEAEETVVEATEEMAAEGSDVHFGKMIDAEGALTIDNFAAEMGDADSMEVKISAIVEEVCQKKGCWMKVPTADGGSMRVKFKDYGFFVPKDLSGKEVVFSGMAYKSTTSVEDLKHYAEDAGESPEEIAAITEPETSLTFIADGVMIR